MFGEVFANPPPVDVFVTCSIEHDAAAATEGPVAPTTVPEARAARASGTNARRFMDPPSACGAADA
jgi:hypothetical protein